jgi:hypothetical protein
MHVIRLKEPWEVLAGLEPQVWIFSRKFHRPTGAEDCVISLVVELQEEDRLVARLNGNLITPQSQTANVIRFHIGRELLPFNNLELQVTTRHISSAEPSFGKSVIQSVELQIA